MEKHHVLTDGNIDELLTKGKITFITEDGEQVTVFHSSNPQEVTVIIGGERQ